MGRVFVVQEDKWTTDEIAESARMERVYRNPNGKRSRYPFVLMGVGDKAFVAGEDTGGKAYQSAMNMSHRTKGVRFIGYRAKHEGQWGVFVRRIK